MGRNFVRAMVCILLCGAATSAAAIEPLWEASTSVSYASSDFGANSTTTSSGLWTGIARNMRQGRVSLAIPYEDAKTSGEVRMVGGVPRRTGLIGDFRPRGRVSSKGIGDMILRGQYRIRDEREDLPTVLAGAFIKFPTGDENKGLGTGEFDHGVDVGVSKHLSDKGVGYLNLGYTWIGMPPGVFLDDQWNVGFGYGYFFSEYLSAGIFYEQAEALLPEMPNARDLVLGVSLDVTPDFRIKPSLRLGLSEGSADYVLSAEFITRF